MSLHLKKLSKPLARAYESEELTFYKDEIKLSGTLIKPAAGGPFPALVLVHGSGAQGRDMWEYRSHGYSLAKRGIAVLLYDKRGVGNSTGDYKTANFGALAEDAIAGIKTLKGRDDIMVSSVGLFGISQGGWISAIATRMNESADFVVMLQGPSVSLEEQEFHRVKYSLEADGFAKSSVDSALEHTRNYFGYVNEQSGWNNLTASSKAASNSTWADYVITASSKDDPNFQWWRTNAYDPAYDLQSIKVPVLAIFGEIDTAVPVKENRPKMEEFLTKAGVKFEIAVIPGLHHSVTTYQGLHGGDNWDWPRAFWKWSRRPAELDEIISKWILGQIR
ncbi:MAG: alpha/beta hydrolase [candidate division Zixibacteria bacterium]|nr:alpha/beta hydrolase [candidate division Zixibacteria bacterium]